MKLEPVPCGSCKSYSFRVRNYLRDKEIFGSGERYGKEVVGDDCVCGRIP